jgi:hypothetical protein
MQRSTVLLSLLSTALLLPAFAGVATPQLDARLARQEHRIEHGVASGALTSREAARLERKSEHIERMEARMEADGKLNRAERAKLHHVMDKQSARIYRQKHDRQSQ